MQIFNSLSLTKRRETQIRLQHTSNITECEQDGTIANNDNCASVYFKVTFSLHLSYSSLFCFNTESAHELSDQLSNEQDHIRV